MSASRTPTVVLATVADLPEATPSDALYAQALERRGLRVLAAPWNGPREAFDGAAAVVIRSTWGYYRSPESFRDWADAMTRATRLFNPMTLVRWNLRKDYLDRLALAGIRVPRSYLVAGEAAAVEQAFVRNGWDHAVVKPAIGASGYFVERVARHELAAAVAQLPAEAKAAGVLVQEFLPEIAEGELSLIYFDGDFSHAVRKRPPAGEFRVNSRFGAIRSIETPSAGVIGQGAAVLRALPERPLYARVDGVVRDGTLIVIEVEVLEPGLFMDLDPPSADRFAEATLRHLS